MCDFEIGLVFRIAMSAMAICGVVVAIALAIASMKMALKKGN